LPPLPGPRWVELEVIAGGICGTDIGNLSFSASPILEPFGSFPAVLGHEILARVASVGAAVHAFVPGQRVLVDPLVSCQVRGYPHDDWCPSCRAGRPAACHRAGDHGPMLIDGRSLAPGLTLGYHRDLPGGWGERLLAHDSQLVAVDDRLSDAAAVLIEPLSVAVHAVLRCAPPMGAEALVIGSGPIALATVWALRALGHDGAVVVQAKRPRERALALALGASDVTAPEDATTLLLRTGARAYQPMVGPAVYAGGGFPVIYDCVGSRASLNQALRYAAARGTIVLLGCAATMRALDLTLLWARELDVRGVVGYGREAWSGEALHTFVLTQRLLETTGAPVADMVTHTYPLDRYRTALSAARNRRVSGAIKVVLTPPPGSLPP
ncbi:MAG: alcohol dehydrogenase catalytic domain-containing protein, partial [Gemmatimonadales bacterium]|nr:alcohol dehydrogenase catalytic domain-containing protein [Gemmatimonadales bacterium]